MHTPSRATPTGRHWRASSPVVLGAFAGIAATAMCLCLLRSGIRLNGDSWIYWQGSVSLLSGLGYTTFDQYPIRVWPPVYPLYLAAMQALLGVSGRTLVVATSLLAGGAAFVWTVVFARGARPTPPPLAYALLFPPWIALMLASSFDALLADELAIVLMGIAIALALPDRSAPDRPARRTALLVVALALLASAKNSAVAFVPAAACLAWAAEHRPLAWRAIARTAVVAIAPIAIWMALRVALGQGGSHAIVLDSGRDPVQWAGVLFASVAQLLVPWGSGVANAVCMGVWFALFAALLRDRTIPEDERRAVAALVLSLLVYAVALITVLLATVVDRPEGRFIWCLPIALVGALWTLGARASRGLRLATGVFLGGLLAALALKTGVDAYQGVRAPKARDVEWHHTIDPAFTGPGTQQRGDRLLVAPPPPFMH